MGELFSQLVRVDLFFLFRRLLVIVCSVYAAVRLGQSAWRWFNYLIQPGRSHELLRNYLAVYVLSIRFRRFMKDYMQIGALVGVLAVMIWLHGLVRAG